MTDCVVITTTAGSRADADAIATALVGRRLAACVQLTPIASTYRWEGTVQHDDEWLLQIKTTLARSADVERCITELSSYAVPEIVALPIAAGSAAYLDWVRASVVTADA